MEEAPVSVQETQQTAPEEAPQVDQNIEQTAQNENAEDSHVVVADPLSDSTMSTSQASGPITFLKDKFVIAMSK